MVYEVSRSFGSFQLYDLKSVECIRLEFVLFFKGELLSLENLAP
jgi:hypothetical protein